MGLGVAHLVAIVATAQAPPPLGADELHEMLKAQGHTLRSAAFIYEGTTRWTGPADLVKDPKTWGDEFQGAFLYRSDGAALLDVYVKAREPTASVARRKMAVLGGQYEAMRVLLDAKTRLDPERDIQTGPGEIGSLSTPQGPFQLFQPWYWRATAPFRERGYVFHGWETIDGSRCAKFQIDSWTGGHKSGEDYEIFWIDLERNGHTVRSETYADKNLTVRIDDVRLQEFPLAEGVSYWMPMHCRVRGYFWKKSYTEPLHEKTISIVNGSLMLDRNFPDGLFSIRRGSALPLPGELERIAKSSDPHGLRRKFSQQAPEPSPRVDPVSVRTRIEEQLKEADRQADQIEASSPARTAWSGARVLQAVLGALGIAAVAVALIRWRMR